MFAQLLTTSPHLLSGEAKSKILHHMEEFLDTADYTEVREEEVTNGYKWSTLVPFMKLAYHPYPRLGRQGTSRHDSVESDSGCMEVSMEEGWDEGEEEESRLAR